MEVSDHRCQCVGKPNDCGRHTDVVSAANGEDHSIEKMDDHESHTVVMSDASLVPPVDEDDNSAHYTFVPVRAHKPMVVEVYDQRCQWVEEWNDHKCHVAVARGAHRDTHSLKPVLVDLSL